jgi:hypothetical protein
MAITTKPVSSASIKNDGGTVVMGGNKAANSRITNAPHSQIVAFPIIGQAIGSKITTASNILKKALSSGNLATMTAGKYVMTWLSNTLAGVPTTQLKSPSNRNINNLRSIHKIESIWTTRSVLAGWSYKGKYLTAPTVAEDVFKALDGNTNNIDNAANPTRALPGELVFRDGSAEPKKLDYNERTD